MECSAAYVTVNVVVKWIAAIGIGCISAILIAAFAYVAFSDIRSDVKNARN